MNYAICFSAVDGVLDGAAGNYLSIFFKLLALAAKFLQSSIVECFLIIVYELFAILWRQPDKLYVCQCMLLMVMISQFGIDGSNATLAIFAKSHACIDIIL